MKIIIGLGNPGKKYEKTRHNVGFMVLDALAGKEKWNEDKKGNFLYLEVEKMKLIKPTTFMNNSGKVLAYLKKKNSRLKLSDFIVVHDDKDIEFGKIKIATDSSSAGHNGVQSIIDSLGSKNFTRIRIGVKNELLDKMPTDKFVLAKFSKEETKELGGVIIKAVKLIEENV